MPAEESQEINTTVSGEAASQSEEGSRSAPSLRSPQSGFLASLPTRAAKPITQETEHFLAPFGVTSDTRNARIDKRLYPELHAQPTTKIITESGAIYELLGTLNREHSQQLFEQSGAKKSGKISMGYRSSGRSVRFARLIDESGKLGDIVVVKKFRSREAAEKEWNNHIAVGQHPSISHARDIAHTEDKEGNPLFCIFIDYAAGNNVLDERKAILSGLSDNRTKQATQNRICEIAKNILNGVSAMHEAGIHHRDLKPDNIIINSDASVKIIDLGESGAAPSSFNQTDSASLATRLLQLSHGNFQGLLIRVADTQGSIHNLTRFQIMEQKDNLDIDSIPGNSIEEVAAKLAMGLTPKDALKLPYFANRS